MIPGQDRLRALGTCELLAPRRGQALEPFEHRPVIAAPARSGGQPAAAPVAAARPPGHRTAAVRAEPALKGLHLGRREPQGADRAVARGRLRNAAGQEERQGQEKQAGEAGLAG